jgi:gamma-glutamylaminecyclotransferase
VVVWYYVTMNDEDIFMQELASDPDYVAWCDQRKQEAMDEMCSMSDDQIEAMFPQKYMVFVYGSLKRGFGNHKLLEGSKFFGITETVYRNFRMHPLLGSFPAVTVAVDDAFAIMGELYEVDSATMKRLDLLEGNGSMYTRRLVSVYNGSEIVEAWMYLMSENDRLVKNNMVYSTNRFVYTDNKLGTQEWFQG